MICKALLNPKLAEINYNWVYFILLSDRVKKLVQNIKSDTSAMCQPYVKLLILAYLKQLIEAISC